MKHALSTLLSPQSKGKKKGKGKNKNAPFPRRLSRWTACASAACAVVLSTVGAWYAGHPADWIRERNAAWPRFLTVPLLYFGDRTRMLTDAMGVTGHDAVYDYDEDPPVGQILFAGEPVRTGAPAPNDAVVLERGDFKVAWSPSLRHPLWAAYHVPREAPHEAGKRPSFRKDRDAVNCPAPSAYTGTDYDRGHLAPNHAIATRFGPRAQADTFMMSNVAPQSPALNRGPWREIERRIADLWAKKYGEIWVLSGTISGARDGVSRQTLSGSAIDVPTAFWTLLAAQDENGVRALALVMPQTIPWRAFPVHNVVSIDELERRTGLDFFPDLPDFIQKPLEADVPTRLWPIRFADLLGLVALRFN